MAVGVPLVAAGGQGSADATNGASALPSIAMLIFRPCASVVVYTKRLLHEDEVPFFVPGGDPLVLEVNGRRLALSICYEAVQREHVEASVGLGVHAYLASVAKHARGVSEAHEQLAAVAREYAVSVVMANAIGPFADGVAAGGSAAWRPDGTLASHLGETREGLVVLDLDDAR